MSAAPQAGLSTILCYVALPAVFVCGTWPVFGFVSIGPVGHTYWRTNNLGYQAKLRSGVCISSKTWAEGRLHQRWVPQVCKTQSNQTIAATTEDQSNELS